MVSIRGIGGYITLRIQKQVIELLTAYSTHGPRFTATLAPSY